MTTTGWVEMPIHSPALKLIWAEEHLNQLKSEVESFTAEQPYEVIRESDSEPGQDVFRLRQLSSPPMSWPLLIGDCVHNVRSALDHLAHDICVTPDDVTAFPIMEDRLGPKGGVRPFDISGGVHPDALTLIEELQPYHRLDDPTLHPLWILNYLDIVDKHRTLNAVTMAVPIGKITFFDATGKPLSTGFRPGPFVDRAEIARLPSPYGEGVKVEANFTTLVTLQIRGAGRDGEAVGVLTELLNYVKKSVVPLFSVYKRR